MSNVAKLKKRAAEFEQKRQYDKALTEYLKVLEEIEKQEDDIDVSLYNRVGDLLQRQGNVAEAVTYYEKAVDLYSEGGFFNNAIALCNKILRQAPGRHIIYYKLGKISAAKGFKSDAKQNFLEYADRMQQAGQIDEAFRALKEFADLCPDQDDIRLMLAEQLSRRDRKEEALEQLQSLYDKFESEGRRAEARATVDRMKAINPEIEIGTKGANAPQQAKSSDLVFLNVDEPVRAAPREPTPAASPIVAPARSPTPAAGRPGSTPPRAAPRALADIPLLDVDYEAAAAAEQADWTTRPTVPSPVAGTPIGSPAIDEIDTIDQTPTFSSSPKDSATIEPLELDTGLPGVAADDGFTRGAGLGEAEIGPPSASDSLLGFEPTTFDAAGAGAADIPRLDVEPGPSAIEGFDTGRAEEPPLLDRERSLLDEERAPLADLPPSAAPTADLPLLDVDEAADSGPPVQDLPLILPDDPTADVRQETRSSGALLDDLTPPVSRRTSPQLAALDVDGLDLEIASDDASALTPRSSDVVSPSSPLDDLPMLDVERTAEGRPPRASGARTVDLSVNEGLLDFELAQADQLGTLDETPADLPAPVTRETPTPTNAVEAILPEVLAPRPGEVSPALLDYAADSGSTDLAAFDAADLVSDTTPAVTADMPALDEAGADVDQPMATGEMAVDATPVVVAPVSATPLDSTPVMGAPAVTPPASPEQVVADLARQIELAPNDPVLRRRYAEALLEIGDREGGLRELDHVMLTHENQGDLAAADSIVDEIVRVNPSSIRHYQKRVELAFRLNERPRLVEAYVQLADALFRLGQPDKARAVYQRVLDLHPTEQRALAGLRSVGGLTPPGPARTEVRAAPPPAPPKRPAADAARAPEVPRPAAPAPAAKKGSDDDFVDLGDWLREDEEPKSTRMVVEEKEPTGDEQADFQDMLRKFKQGVAANVEEEDYDSHYDLGVAYKEMGLVDEAIAEFQKALRGSNHRVRAYEALGYCFMEKQQYQVAETILTRALHEPGLTDDQLVGVLYELGQAAEELNKPAEAVRYYQRVFAVDIQFRDVGERLNALQKVAR